MLADDVDRKDRDMRFNAGLQKLNELHKAKPRKALRSMANNSNHAKKRDNAVKKIFNLYRTIITEHLQKFKDAIAWNVVQKEKQALSKKP